MRSKAIAEELEWKRAQQARLEKWKRGVDRDLDRYYELNPQHSANKPGKQVTSKSK